MRKNIVLIGMPGCGKTTLGKIIGNELNVEFYDMDKYIENTTEKKISELFHNGESYFREIETSACSHLSQMKNVIISTGGGVIKKEENIRLLESNGLIIFIDRPLKDLLSDIDISNRPLLKDGKDKMIQLYEERYQLYKKYAHITIMNDTNLSDAKNKLIEIYKNNN